MTNSSINTKAIVVLSGGQDSTFCLLHAAEAHGAHNVHAVTFNYGQRHSLELAAAETVARIVGVASHEVVTLGPILQGTSPLTDPTQTLETYQSFEQMDAVIGDRIEKTFVPMRNALFLTLAGNRAVVHGAPHIYTGVCQQDNANYPDCTVPFITRQEEALRAAVLQPLHIHTPLMHMRKSEAIHVCLKHGRHWYGLLGYTHTAYDGQFPPVGSDHATLLRAHGFEEAGVPDPLVVRAHLLGKMELPDTPNYKGSGNEDLMHELMTYFRDVSHSLKGN